MSKPHVPPPPGRDARVTRPVPLRGHGSGPHLTRARTAPRVLGDRYELRRRIGAGGMAEVFLATDLVLERDVAVKVLHGRLAADPSQVDRFRREALTLAGLDSPRIIAVHDLHLGPDEHYLVMQYVIGRTFEQMMEECGPLVPERAARIIADLLDGLAVLHMRGLIHRDIKPSNVLIDWDDRAILIDLGVASDKRRPSMTPPNTTVGTPSFMAPEQRETGLVDQRSDVYQVGALLLLALTSRDPSGLTAEDRTAALATVPAPLARVIARAMDDDPAARWPSADAMRAALARALVQPPEVIEVETLQIVDIDSAKPPAQRRVSVKSLAIDAVVAVGLIAGFFWMTRGHSTESAGADAAVTVAAAEPVAAPAPIPDEPEIVIDEPAPVVTAAPAPKARRARAARAAEPEALKRPEDYLYLADLYESSGATDSAVQALRLYQRVAPAEAAAAEQRIKRLRAP